VFNKEEQILAKFISTFLTLPGNGNCGERNIVYIKQTVDRLLNLEREIPYDRYAEIFRNNGFTIIEDNGITIDRKGNKFRLISIKLYAKEIKMLRLMTSRYYQIGDMKLNELNNLKEKFKMFNLD
jgi:mRNA-degrading endonuclease HigB of HigAB toxin-antitoxin module